MVVVVTLIPEKDYNEAEQFKKEIFFQCYKLEEYLKSIGVERPNQEKKHEHGTDCTTVR
jgi:hypothetical protein